MHQSDRKVNIMRTLAGLCVLYFAVLANDWTLR